MLIRDTAVTILSVTCVFLLTWCFFVTIDGRTQYAENKVIIEQLCNLDETSYFCGRLK